jgi:hypothetical protein
MGITSVPLNFGKIKEKRKLLLIPATTSPLGRGEWETVCG